MEKEQYEEVKKQQILEKMNETDAKVQKALKEKEEEQLLKREIENLKRID